MPFGDEGPEEGIAVALSGGGYRAMLFHIGALWRLNQMGQLRTVERISSVSGGTLAAARLAVRWKHLNWQGDVATNFVEEVAAPVFKLGGRRLDAPAVLLGLLPRLSAANVAAAYYRRYLVGNATLQDLPSDGEGPRFVFNSTHLATATSWRFSKPYMGTYRVGLIRNPALSVATAVAASAAFPPFLSPLRLKLDPSSFEKVEGADLYSNVALRRLAVLSDGGVYDNLGLQTCERFSTLLVSDAGGELALKAQQFRWWPAQLRRVIDTATEQTRALRRSDLLDDLKATPARKRGTLWRTGTNLTKYPASSPFQVDPNWRHEMSTVPTRLWPFDKATRCRLVNWGYVVADVAMRSWVVPDASPPTELPYTAYGFSGHPTVGLTSVAGDTSG
jgi:NTE family protein